jgi:threonylcarbamoyladenosine tRNA methylthiotransferase MtaB
VARYHVENFGCRTSQADGDAIAAALDALGAIESKGLRQADVVVVNTCTVTAAADGDARASIRRIQRANPQSRIVVTGCYAQRAAQEIAALPGVFAVVGNSHKSQVASIALGGMLPNLTSNLHSSVSEGFVPLTSLHGTQLPYTSRQASAFLLASDIFAHTEFQLPSFPAAMVRRSPDAHAARRTRPSLKIQDGCGNRCTFCVIPSTRGNSRSHPHANVLAEVEQFVDAGGKELVITGINLGRWGRDLTPQDRLEDLLAEIFESTALRRLRISSVEPMDWTDGLVALFARWSKGDHPRLARHAHLPLQSGADAVLRRMHRRYRPWHYAERVAKIRAASPDAAIGADVMVGFPGETETEFQENYDFIAAQPFTYLHLFPFSARPGTAGWELHGQNPVPGEAVKERMAALRALIDTKNLAFRSAFVGKRLSAMTLIASESAADFGRGSALTDNFLPVGLDSVGTANTVVTVQITASTASGLSGTVVENRPGYGPRTQ